MLQLLRHYAQSDTLIRQLWDPLCLAALNTPTAQASAGLYARVLRDSLGGRREASDLLLPCTDLSALWPDAAARHLTMRYGSTVRQLQPSQDGVVVNQERFDAAVLAVPPAFAARLLDAREAGAGGLLDALKSFDYLPIATLNLRLAGPWRLPELHDDAARGSARGHLANGCSTARAWSVTTRQASWPSWPAPPSAWPSATASR